MSHTPEQLAAMARVVLQARATGSYQYMHFLARMQARGGWSYSLIRRRLEALAAGAQ